MQEMQNLKQIRDDLKEGSAIGTVSKEQAVQDLRFLCSRMGYGLLNNVKLFSFHDASSKKLCDFLVVGHDTSTNKAVNFPTSDINVDDPNMYVAVVVYDGGKVRDAYLFPTSEFKKPAFLSKFKNKKGVCSINIGSEDKLREYSFGHVIGGIVN